MGIRENSGHGKDLLRGIWVYKGHSDLRVRGRLEEAEAEKSKVDSSLPPSLLPSLRSFLPSFRLYFYQHTISKLIVL